MTIDRRKVLAGLAGMAATTAAPALAQFGAAIQPQNDPWAQVDPYADPRNGHPSQQRGSPMPQQGGKGVFENKGGRPDLAGAEQDEIAIGASDYRAGLQEAGGVYPDPRVQKAMRDFAQPFFHACDRPDLPWEINVARKPFINAWAMPGGKLCFYPGILGMCDHPGELGAVLAHEIGHAVLRHGLIKRDGINAAVEAARRNPTIVGDVPIGALIPGAEKRGIDNNLDLLITGLTRENEDEADAYSVDLLRRMGIDPRWSAAMLAKLGKVEKAGGGEHVHDLLLDHAHPRDRMSHVLQLCGGATPNTVVNFSVTGWETLKAAFPTPTAFKNR